MAKQKTITGPSLFEEQPLSKKKEHETINTILPNELPVQTVQPTEKTTGKTAMRRDGQALALGEEVYCDYPGRNYEGKVFIITEINDWEHCESKFLIIGTNKINPQEKATSYWGGKGLDANWFRKV